MKQDVTFQDFVDAFRGHDRQDQFTYAGLQALYDYLEDEDMDMDMEEYNLDVIALCVEFTQYVDLAELKTNYTDIESMEDLEDHTVVIPVASYGPLGSPIPGEGFIIRDY